MALLPTRPLPFSQPSPDATAAGGHPHKNLGKFLHPPKEIKRHNVRPVPHPTGKKFQPRGNSKASNPNLKVKPVAGPNMGQSDVNSEAIGSLMGPASTGLIPPAFKSRKAKAKQMPFYG
jgi:hypothetical protein